MTRNTGRTVSLRHDGLWANKPNDSLRPVSVHPRQSDAIDAARQGLRAAGGGHLLVRNSDGTVLHRETVASEADGIVNSMGDAAVDSEFARIDSPDHKETHSDTSAE